ncbi:MAG: hypothetical protein K9M99_07540 [Candidatus Cloacimonetes bacterium]|nr:hypothetical protein [Candidatus Cloacimonadota bacterium]
MKRLADLGVGLNSQINYHVRKYYSRKVSEVNNRGTNRIKGFSLGEVELSLRLFKSIKDNNKKWSCNKTMEIFTRLDEYYDFTGLDALTGSSGLENYSVILSTLIEMLFI